MSLSAFNFVRIHLRCCSTVTLPLLFWWRYKVLKGVEYHFILFYFLLTFHCLILRHLFPATLLYKILGLSLSQEIYSRHGLIGDGSPPFHYAHALLSRHTPLSCFTHEARPLISASHASPPLRALWLSRNTCMIKQLMPKVLTSILPPLLATFIKFSIARYICRITATASINARRYYRVSAILAD